MKQIIIPEYLEPTINEYYENNAEKLNKMIDKILLKFGGLSGKDMDDFYSLANEVIVDVIKRYDKSQSFEAFLYSCLLNKIKSEMTKRNREKRKADRMSISIDTPVGEDENTTLGDTIPSNFNLEKEIFQDNEEMYSSKMLLYLSKLSALQKQVLEHIVAGYLPSEIKEELHINDKQFADCKAAIHSCRNVSVLF